MLAPSTAPLILAIKYFYREQFGINLKKRFWYFSKSTSLRRRWSTSGTRSWRSTAWRRSGGSGCSRRCRGSGWGRTKPSTTSSGPLSDYNNHYTLCNCLSVECEWRSRAGWCLMTTLWTTTPVSSKWAAVSAMRGCLTLVIMPILRRLRHDRDGHLQVILYLWPGGPHCPAALSTHHPACCRRGSGVCSTLYRLRISLHTSPSSIFHRVAINYTMLH